jgi:uncharacterized protein
MKTIKKQPPRLTALITGASSGLGEAIAKNCAARGFNLVMASENSKELDRVRREIEKKYSCRAIALTVNLFKPNSAERLFALCQKGKLDIDLLANCAGIYLNVEREMREVASLDNIIHLHILSFTKLCFLFGREMIKRGRGYILNVSSIAARFPDPASLTYGPSKRYILSLSEALHCDWKEHNIKVTCLTPGGIRTNFFKANKVFIPPVIKSTMITAERCAEIGLNALFKGRAVITPGVLGKLQSFFLRIISRRTTYDMIKKSYFSMKKNSPQPKNS